MNMVPTAFYSHADIEIYIGDAREILPHLPRGLTVTDPPYNLGYDYDVYQDNLGERAYQDLLQTCIVHPSVVIHYPEALFRLAISWGIPPEKVVAWVYNANTPRQWRSIGWWGILPDFTLSGQPYKNPTDVRVRRLIENGNIARLYDWWHIDQVKNVSEEKTEHPCQIPLEVMKKILSITPNPALIIDPFMGSGTTLRAAKDLGRPAIGIEISQDYAEQAVARLSQERLM